MKSGKDQSKAKRAQLNKLLDKGMQIINRDKNKHNKYYEKLQRAHSKLNKAISIQAAYKLKADTTEDDDDNSIVFQKLTLSDSGKKDNTVEISIPKRGKTTRGVSGTLSGRSDERIPEDTVKIKSFL